MSTSQRTINQVRSILGRLDRSIDEARDRRLKGESPESQKPSRGPTEPILADEPDRAGRAAGTNPAATSQAAASAPPPVGPARATPKPPSPFGRAKPLRKTGSDDAPTEAWKK